MRAAFLIFMALASGIAIAAEPDGALTRARERWRASAHGEMLERIIPPYMEPSRLPEAGSDGARLTARYCVQCHNLPSPAMHDAGKWPAIVARMLPRMQGRGNLGRLMHDLMADMSVPGSGDIAILVHYLQRHAQTSVEANALPEAGHSTAWTSYAFACAQCHVLPDPRRHTRAEWPAVVARMESNMAWMNRVVGSKRDPREPQYRTEEILSYLQKHARR